MVGPNGADPAGLVIEPNGASLCDADPGFAVDATIDSDLRTLHCVLNGREAMASARRDERLAFSGTPAITRRLPDVLTLTTLAELAQLPA